MKTCPKCQSSIGPTDRFCTACGSSTATPPPPPVLTEKLGLDGFKKGYNEAKLKQQKKPKLTTLSKVLGGTFVTILGIYMVLYFCPTSATVKEDQNPSVTIKPSDPPTGNAVISAQTVSKERQAYLDAVNNYNSFIEHPKGHVYNVYPKNREVEMCYLSAQVVVAASRDPVFAGDLNSNGENQEWRRWIDIRKYELRCYKF